MLTGPLFSEPMRVETVRPNGPDAVEVGLVGQRTERFRRVTLTAADIASLSVASAALTYEGDGQLLRLGLQAYTLGIAHEFDPYFGLSISRVDPLPHQLEAVYDYFMKLPSVRFLLADDAGAGKTIMAGLLIRELKLRGLAERTLVVCPANLTFQWQRELKREVRSAVSGAERERRPRPVRRQPMAQPKAGDYFPRPRQARGHPAGLATGALGPGHRRRGPSHVSASDETHKSQRYRLGELLRDSAPTTCSF